MNDYFIVQAKDSKGQPLKIQNKFKYQVSGSYEKMSNKFADYRSVPVCLFNAGAIRPDGADSMASMEANGW